jgi:hypothetical protein
MPTVSFPPSFTAATVVLPPPAAAVVVAPAAVGVGATVAAPPPDELELPHAASVTARAKAPATRRCRALGRSV